MITQPLQYQPVLEPRSLRGVMWRQINKETTYFQLRGTENTSSTGFKYSQ